MLIKLIFRQLPIHQPKEKTSFNNCKNKDMSSLKTFTNGLLKESPTFTLLLGMCPTLGVTSSASNGVGMGLATTFVLVMSNLVISLVKGFIPDKVRIPAFIVIIATFVTIVEMTMKAYLPGLFAALGIFIPLIVVNCIVLGRAEAFASKNGAWASVLDGLGMGFGFTLALCILGSIRELLGTGRVFNHVIYPEEYGIIVFVLAPGAFIALGFLIAFINKAKTVYSRRS
jgi:electron transport complex protein RnfE